VAAFIETGMLALFAFLVWGPNKWVVSKPDGTHPVSRLGLTAFFITWVIGASALLIANNIASNKVRLTERGQKRRGHAETVRS